MYKIKTLNKISDDGLGLFDKSKYLVGEDIEDPDAILLRSANMHDYKLSESTLAIARAGAGVNNIPIDECTKNGVVVFNTPGANANAVKELAIASLLIASRDIVGGVNWVKNISDEKDLAKEVEKGKKAFLGPELAGKTLGVFGLGAIGSMVANVAIELGMKVYGYDPFITVESAWMLSRSVMRATNKNEIFEKCDYVSLHLPSTSDTKDFFDLNTVSIMKNNIRIINLSRSDLINTEAMKKALEEKKVTCYVTDFPTKELLVYNNVISIPHLGASTPESEENCARMAVNEIIDFLENGNIRNSVNFPNLLNPKGGDQSICVIHDNVPNMLAQISSTISEEGINIENLSSRSKKDVGYSVFEIIGRCSSKVVDKLNNTKGIRRVMLIDNNR